MLKIIAFHLAAAFLILFLLLLDGGLLGISKEEWSLLIGQLIGMAVHLVYKVTFSQSD